MQQRSANAIVGSNVALYRVTAGLSQAQLAEALARKLGKKSVDPTTITRLEKGTRPTTVDELFALGSIFEVPVESLLPKPSPVLDLLGSVEWEKEKWGLKRHQAMLQVAEAERHEEKLAQLLAQAQKIRRYQQTQEDEGVAEALQFLVRHAYGYGTDLESMDFDFYELLLDAGMPPEAIADAVKRVGKGADVFNPMDAIDELSISFFGRTPISSAKEERSVSEEGDVNVTDWESVENWKPSRKPDLIANAIAVVEAAESDDE